jgi:two-component system, OmpR family, response regulator
MRILVLEDEHKIASSIKKGLEQESFAVDLAFAGNEGYDLASSENYDLIILDVMLPEMSGVEICKKLREQNNHTPILMLTARGQVSDKVEGLNSGADDYLTKPFAFEELLARVKALSRRPKNSTGSIYKVADLTLNTLTYEVRRGDKQSLPSAGAEGKKVNLSSKEFSLLEYLMRNAGQVLSKDQIIEHVWDYDADVLPNTVEVFIGYLRNKLGKPDLIKTVRGFGYKIGE